MPKDGGAVLEADLDFDGGVTTATIEEFIKTFRTVLETWVDFVLKGATTSATGSSSPHVKRPSATKRIQTPFGKFVVWVDELKWKPAKADEPGVLVFDETSGAGYSKIITERIGIPTDSLKAIVLANMRTVDSNAKITLEETRMVNGKKVLVLQYDATYQQVPFRFYGYFHGGSSGTIQVITWTSLSLFDSNIARLTDFLDGLEIMDEDLPASSQPSLAPNTSVPSSDGLLDFNAGKMSVKYDPKK